MNSTDTAAQAPRIARRVTVHEARRHFEAGGDVMVSERGHRETQTVTATTVTHNRTRTTWDELAATVKEWRNKYPNQRFYVVPAPTGELAQAQAEAAGRAAYAAGGSRAPGVNATVLELVEGLPVGHGAADIFRAFTRGFEAAADEAAAQALTDDEQTVTARTGTYVVHNGRRLAVEYAGDRRDLLQAYVDGVPVYTIPGGARELVGAESMATLDALRAHVDRADAGAGALAVLNKAAGI